jgi:hypothetical protein
VQFDVNNPVYVSPAVAASRIQSGWLAQYRGSSLVSAWIRLVTGGVHSHSAMFEKGDYGINVLELREFKGGRALPLERHLMESPKRIDVFAPAVKRFPEWNGHEATGVMRLLTVQEYGYWSILYLLLRHLPFVWRLFPLSTSDVYVSETKNIRPFCSHAVAVSCELGGNVDPVPRLPAHEVTPAHLTWSLLWEYQFTIGDESCGPEPESLPPSSPGYPFAASAL